MIFIYGSILAYYGVRLCDVNNSFCVCRPEGEQPLPSMPLFDPSLLQGMLLLYCCLPAVITQLVIGGLLHS